MQILQGNFTFCFLNLKSRRKVNGRLRRDTLRLSSVGARKIQNNKGRNSQIAQLGYKCNVISHSYLFI